MNFDLLGLGVIFFALRKYLQKYYIMRNKAISLNADAEMRKIMRKNRKQGLAIFLTFSLLVSMAPSTYLDASVVENSVFAPESTVPIPTEVQKNDADTKADVLPEIQGNGKDAEADDSSEIQENSKDTKADDSSEIWENDKNIGVVDSTETNRTDTMTNQRNSSDDLASATPDISSMWGSVHDLGHIQSARNRAAAPQVYSAETDYLDVGNCGANLTYVLDQKGCLSITGEGDMTNYTDASAVPWFSLRSLITKVSFSGNITNIGAYAFDYCVNLTSITLPDSVISIGAYSFYGCSGLREITVPKNATGIGAYAFAGCSNLSTVTISGSVTSIGASAFAGCTSLTAISIPDSVTSIGEGAFDNTGVDTSQIAFYRGNCGTNLKWALLGNHQLRVYGTGAMTDFSASSAPWYHQRENIVELVLSDGVSGIGDYAFVGCKALKSVVLADSVSRIGKHAFAQCSGISGLDLGKITEIGESAFEQSGLTELRISGGATITIGNDAFAGCAALKTVRLEQCTLKAGDRIWKGCAGLETVMISAGFTEIGSSLFADCTILSQLTLTGNCSAIGAYQFSGCTALTDIRIPNGVIELGSYAFQNCTGISEITLPDSVTAIQAGVFSGCRGLEKIQFSKQLESIGDFAFQNCILFTSLIIPDSVTSMGSGVFSGCSKLESLSLPFVGSGKEPEEASQETLFAYIFGTANYAEASVVKQYYSDSGYSTYYLPDSLTRVTVTGGKLLYGAFDHCSNIKQISIPDSVTSIAPYVFRDCKGLDHIEIADGVTGIGKYAFSGCSGLTGISLPDNLQSIDSAAFLDCTALEKITLPQQITKIADKLFQGCSALQEIGLTGQVESIGEEAFRGCEAIKNISLPSKLTELGSGAFRDCTSLQRITVPAGITFIGEYTFSACTALQEAVIAGKVTEIGAYAFSQCALLKSVQIPETVTEIGSHAFSNCEAITSLKLPREITQIGSYAFQNCVGLTGMEVPENTQIIGAAAFSGCSALQRMSLPFVGGAAEAENASSSTAFGYIFGTTAYQGGSIVKQFYSNTKSVSYYIPDALTEVEIVGGRIWYGAFSACNHLESIRFLSTESVTDISAKAFQGCAGLTNLTLPNGVQTIGDYAFSGCVALKAIPWINEVKTIGSYAFQNCSSIKSVSLPQSLTTINTAVFSGCSSLESISLPFVGSSASLEAASATSLFGYIFGSVNYTGAVAVGQKYSVSKTATYYLPSSLKKVTISGGKILYGAFYGCSSLTQLTLPEELTEIGDYAFYNCTGITGFTLPKEITKIGSYTFAGCSGLKEMVLPVSVESIGASAFRDCASLQDISIPEKVSNIPSYLFSGCISLDTILIPNGVRTIGAGAFQNCSSMTGIAVPDSVTEIGDAAFAGCGNLQSMTLPFVGKSNSLISASKESLFGYIFGTKNYTGSMAVMQKYSGTGVTYYIPTSLTNVRITGGVLLYGAFYGCSSLTQLTLPENLTEVGKYAFYQCSGLKEISLPSGVTSIGSYAFAGCSALKVFSFPLKVGSIEDYSFSGCVAMDSITIPQGITKIGKAAFQNCSNLTRIIVPDSVREIGDAAFSGCSKLQSMTLPFTGSSATLTSAGSKALFGYIFGTTNYTGSVATKQYYSGSGSTTYYIPASLRNVEITGGNQMLYGTFYNCSGLTGITLPTTLTSIGQKVFYHCSGLSEIIIPQNVGEIAANAFADCSGIQCVTFSGKAPGTIAATTFTGVTATVFYPVSDASWDDIIGNQYGGSLTWQPHTHSYLPAVVAPTCTEQGYTAYQCTGCNSSYIGNFVNALGHVPVIDPAVPATCTRTGLTEGSHCSVCEEVIISQEVTAKAEHRFSEYVSNKDASYEQDGTKTAECRLCHETDTVTDSGSMLIDENKPKLEISVGKNQWTGFFHSITFGLFFKNTQTAAIQASDQEKLLDGSTVNRLDQVYYFLSDTEIRSQELEQVAWREYTDTLTLDPDQKYIVYAKAVDRSNNTTYASSTGMIVDETAPDIDGILDGMTYCEEAVFTVKDLSLQSVTDNGTVIETTEGLYEVAGDDQTHHILATDDCGNTTEMTIVVSRHHKWKDPVFSWGNSYKSCTAEYICDRDSSHMERIDCTIQDHSPDATCVKAGSVVYTATSVLDGAVKTNSQTVSGVVLGHDYEPVFDWGEDHTTCTATLTCQREGCSSDTTGHLLSNLQCVVDTKTTAATCVSAGKREVVASLVVDGVEYQDARSAEVIPMDVGNHVHTRTFNRKDATCLAEGATGDIYCLDCKKIVERSVVMERLTHAWDNGMVTKAASCIETGIQLYTCTNGCGTVWEKEIPIDPEQHGNLRIVGAIEATMTEAGYTGDTYCDDCGQTVVYGSIIPAIGGGESPTPVPGDTEKPLPTPGNVENPSPTPGGLESPSPVPGNTEKPLPTPGNMGASSSAPGDAGGSPSGNGQTDNLSKKDKLSGLAGGSSNVLAKGSIFVAGKLKYKITNAVDGKFTVAVQAPTNKKIKSLTIPAIVKVQDKSYQVTSIAAGAFQKCSKLKKITIGKNVSIIGKNAFYQAKKLKQIVIRSSKMSKVGKNAWKGIHKKAVIRVPKKQRSRYRKLLGNKGQKKTVQIR